MHLLFYGSLERESRSRVRRVSVRVVAGALCFFVGVSVSWRENAIVGVEAPPPPVLVAERRKFL
ncbi:BnaC07g24690D [Brassica napus]|uniref:BnaC07g24690D protein n=1 Tax=Brassica napus TaxID=3708 RepID=A0A078I3J9_BRANA|nr:BnaC07g24690D [Brassica napus]